MFLIEIIDDEEEVDDEEESIPDTTDVARGFGLLFGLFGLILFVSSKRKQSHKLFQEAF